MKYVFNDEVYPVATSEGEIVDLLKSDTVRAVMYRNTELQKDLERVRTGINFHENNSLAMQYHATGLSQKRIETGQNLYMRAIKCEDVLRESADAAIAIDFKSLNIITYHTNEIRDLYKRVLGEYIGERRDETLHSRLLMTPKGGVGRSPFLHADPVDLAAHITFDGAPLYMPQGVISDATWEMIKRRELLTLSEEVCAKAGGRDACSATPHVEFGSARLGDVVFKKGALGKDLDSPEERKGVCPHSSSPHISDYGQVGAVIYSKEPS